MAGAKTLQGQQATDLARFMNDQSEALWKIPLPGTGYSLIVESGGHKIASQKLIDAQGNPVYFEGIQQVTPRGRAAT